MSLFWTGLSFSTGALFASLYYIFSVERTVPTLPKKKEQKAEYSTVLDLIGNTPLVRIESLSEATGCDILGKAEFLSIGGSSKDRVALSIIRQAEALGQLHAHTNSTVFEGTVGSTGISLAIVCRAKGYNCHIVRRLCS